MIARLAALLLGLLLLGGGAAAQDFEHIRDFQVQIEVQPDGAVVVTEQIEVLALGQAIRRGIFRDLQLQSYDALGLFTPDFELLEALRDGQPETYRVEELSSGPRIYLGHPERFLEPGVYRYRLRYRMADQVDRLEDFDELYWNVNGVGWQFAIRSLGATVVLPPGAEVLQESAYTGGYGQQGSDYRVERLGPDRLRFETTRPLGAGENLTVAVGWPKGFVAGGEGGAWLRWMEEQGPLRVAGVLLALLLVYYLAVWWRVGRDPAAGTIVPVYSPELPPAAMRFIRRMGFDNDCVAAALLNLAVKGQVTLEEDQKGTLTLRRAVPPDGSPEASPGEAVLYNGLLGSRGSLTLDKSNQATLYKGREALRRHFAETFDRIFFRRNRGWFLLGAVLTVIGWAVISLTQPVLLVAFLQVIWLGFLAFVLTTLGRQALRLWRLPAGSSGVGEKGALVIIAIFVLFAASAFLGSLLAISGEMGWDLTLAVLALGGVNTLFLHLLKAPTAIGREALDEIEGTRLYLTVAEADRLRFHNPPDRTPEHFEALLPYAVALGVETEWTRQFADLLERAAAARGEESYRPTWYRGRRFSGARFGELGRAVSTAYASAATPKSSGSSGGGSRGGGSSGGGRGGGGGGGW